VSALPKLKPLEAIPVFVGVVAFFVGATVGFWQSGSETLSTQLYITFFSGAGATLLAEVILLFIGAGVVSSLSLARYLRKTSA
jgi:hypothetical protein